LDAVRRAFLRGGIALAVAAALATPAVANAPASDPLSARLGEPVAAVLDRLAASGVRILWSTLLVPPSLVVTAVPTAPSTEARLFLSQLLAPHGLDVEANGALLSVVRAPAKTARGVLRGTVRSRPGLEPVPGALVRLAGTAIEVATDDRGVFELAGAVPGTDRLEVRRPGFVVEDAIPILPAADGELEIVLQPAPLAADEILIEPGRISLLLEEPASPFELSRDEIAALPHLAGDVFRALDLLPGAAGNDVTAQIQVRGGRRDETLVLLDGQEIYDAYHLKDFDNALSVVPGSTLEELTLASGALPASQGDRLGAALSLLTLSPGDPHRYRLGLSLLDLQLEASGRRSAYSWLASARYGSAALAGALFGEEDPSFADVYLKGQLALGERQTLRASALATADDLDFEETLSGERRRFVTEYGSQYAWLTHQAVLSDRLFVDSGVSYALFDRDRRGLEDEEEKSFVVRDERETRVAALLQSWAFEPLDRQTWSAGFELRRYDSTYDYASFRRFESPFAALRAEPRAGAFDFRGELRDDYLGLFASDRLRLSERVTLELGARVDRHTISDDTDWSPRSALAWAVGESSVIRVAWGRQSQSQRTYELMVPDGDTTVYPSERADRSALGYEHRFRSGRFVTAVRGEIYDQRIPDPRPRYESLFEPFEPFFEGELDRVRVEPEASRAQGAELLLRGLAGPKVDWWLSYALARAEDRLEGRWTPRQIDQRHTLNVDVTARLGRAWSLNLAWRFHTGRPTTAVTVELVPIAHPPEGPDDEEPEDPDDPEALTGATHELAARPRLGALQGERLPPYHRLDLRLSRDYELSRGRLTVYADVQNLYDRGNVAGYDLEIDDDATPPALRRAEEAWPGFLASAGVSWRF
jgi:hypothetical protein